MSGGGRADAQPAARAVERVATLRMLQTVDELRQVRGQVRRRCERGKKAAVEDKKRLARLGGDDKIDTDTLHRAEWLQQPLDVERDAGLLLRYLPGSQTYAHPKKGELGRQARRGEFRPAGEQK